MTSKKTAAECVGVVKTYATGTGQVRALRGIDAVFPARAITAVVGPSGSGKSSLLRLLAALDRASDGAVSVGGRDLRTLSATRLRFVRNRVVGYVFQRPSDNFISYLSVAEHLRLAGADDPDELLGRLGLAHRRDRLPSELSGGEQQRAAFAFALAAGPDIVVADEPTAELDSASADELLGLVRTLVSTGAAFVIATHDPNVVRIADEIIELEHGMLRSNAPAHAVPAAVERRAASDSEPLLVGEGLSKTYARGTERIHALDDVTVRLPEDRMIGLFGRSGSGKTTLLNVLGGWERPDRGMVTWSDGARADVDALGWKDLAVLPQRFGLAEELTVRENVEYPARLADVLPSVRDWVDELFARLRLDALQDRVPSETSIGEQQRTALARALVLKPRLLLADEPTGHQDAGSTADVLALLREVSSEGVTSLVATHNAAIAAYFDIVHEMDSGRIQDVTASSQ